MNTNQPLIDHISSRISFSEEEIQEFVSCFKVTKVKKRQFIIQPDFVAKYRNYVVKGAFRAYVVAD
ncbi:hypothetical protein MCETHM1_01981 [Flavobacteriaceae bacterium]